METPPTLTHKLIFDEVLNRSWRIENVSNNSYDVVNDKGKRVHFNLSSPELNARAGVKLSADKVQTLQCVESLGYQVAPFAEYTDQKSAESFLNQHASIVVKPSDGQKSQGVTVGVTTPEQLQAAISQAQKHSKQHRVMLQKQLQGREYRLLVIGGTFFAASYRRPAQVVGDGKHIVADLVASLNDSRQNLDGTLELVDVTSVQSYLGEQYNAVPAKGEIISLSALGGMSAGGEAVDITGLVHPEYVKAIEAIARITGLTVCGFDILAEDISKPVPAYLPLLEINAAPGFKPHAFVSEGARRNPAPALLDYVFSTEAGLKVTYDKSARIAGIGLVPWTRLGPERWFDNYRIASYHDWDMHNVPGVPEVFALASHAQTLPELKKQNTLSLLATPEFRDMLVQNLAGYSFLTYKAVEPPKELVDAGLTFLHMDQQLAARLENKAEFRQLFDGELPFPGYQIVAKADITPDEPGLTKVMQGRDAVVVQDERLSGGKGTYIVRSLDDLKQALDAFEVLDEGSTRLVVSDLIEGARERSVQCVATRSGVFVGPLQKQIVRHPLLSNLDVAEGDRFCGGVLTATDELQKVYPTIKGYAELIGKRLLAMGYRGIFGVDYLVDMAGKVYVIEVNPRLTGMTPLLTMLYREGQDIPFYLLHMLELGGIEYELTGSPTEGSPEGSLLVLHSRHPKAAVVTEVPESGSYDLQGNFLEKRYRMDRHSPDTQLLLQQYTVPGFKVKPGGRLASIYVNKAVLDESDQLLPEIEEAITNIVNRITLEDIEP